MSTEKTREYVGKGVKASNFDLINISISKSKLEDHWFEFVRLISTVKPIVFGLTIISLLNKLKLLNLLQKLKVR